MLFCFTVSSFYIGESSLNPMKVGTNEPTYQSKHSDDLKLKWKEKIGRLSGIFEKKFQNPVRFFFILSIENFG